MLLNQHAARQHLCPDIEGTTIPSNDPDAPAIIVGEGILGTTPMTEEIRDFLAGRLVAYALVSVDQDEVTILGEVHGD